MQEVYLILHNIRSAFNVGSIFRTADGAGVKKIFLTGCSPKPIDEFGKTRQKIHKTALGAEKTVKWEYCREIGNLIRQFKNSYCGFPIAVVGLEQTKGAIDYRKFKPIRRGAAPVGKQGLALIVGNEVRGLSSRVLKKCDSVIKIPMRGKKESLNVAVATGIALYEILK